MKLVIALLAGLLLSSAAPAPRPLMPAVIHLAPPGPVVLQACTYANAPTRFRAVVLDGRGYPYGEVTAWSCLDPTSAQREFAARKAAMEREALATYGG
jgi:hypothetical protein